MTKIERAILDVEKKQVAAFNQGDLKTVLDFFDPHIVCFSSTQHERITGRAGLRRTFEYYLKEAEKVQYRITEPVVQVYGDTAIASFYWTVTLTNGSKRQKIEGRGSHVLLNQNGAWKIVHEHFSRAHHHAEK
ncbi:MAG: nuclear transport factor 2 family protein [Acidobacteria bacterium]|nr:nuclear transport factor 2 family protein [Acidobacteriota bacterium]